MPLRTWPRTVPVLVAGAGPVGLAATIEIAQRGIPTLATERHPGTAIHPKARGINVRTMELFRHWGIEQLVRDAGLPPGELGFFYRGRSLVDADFVRYGGGGRAADASTLSPTTWMVISQDVLEPVLLDHARSLPAADVRFDAEIVDIAQDAGGVDVRVRDRLTDLIHPIRAGHVIGADGANSLVRAALGVPLIGEHDLAHNLSIFFEAPLADVVADRRSAVYYLADDPEERPFGRPMSVGNPPSGGVLLTVDNVARWLLVVAIDPDGGERPEDFTEARCIDLVRRATGLPELSVRVLSLMSWIPSAQVAEHYRVGRCFLAGDAAHQMTPSGAFGLNVGIADAVNVGWKLAGVNAGWAGASLLDTYEAERRPAGVLAADQSLQQFAGTREARPFGNWGVIFGADYESDAIVPDGSEAPVVDDPVLEYVQRGRPGARLPHAWLDRDGARISTHDLLGDGVTLIAGPDGQAWLGAGEITATELGVPLATLRLGGAGLTPLDSGIDALGIGPGGCLLVRPDGHVGWRSAGRVADPRSRLDAALRAVLGRSS